MNILIGITGGIACYKTLEYIRLLEKQNHDIKVIMTSFAKEFISPMIVKTLSHGDVYYDDIWKDNPLCHIELARWADVFVIAPCTLNTLSKVRYGIADNLLTTTVLAYDKYILLAVSSNSVMYEKSIIQEHIKILKDMKFKIVEPIYGLLACNEEGIGKMVEPDELVFYTLFANENLIYKDKSALVIGGATKEYIDKVRFISNGSSGQMARYISLGLKTLGANVDFINVSNMSVDEAYDIILSVAHKYDIIFMNGAISDYKPNYLYDGKIKKTNDKLIIELIKTKDILKSLGDMKKPYQKLIGFALEETENLLENAKIKLKAKNLDAIVANPISVMGASNFEGYVISENNVINIPNMHKMNAGVEILKAISKII